MNQLLRKILLDDLELQEATLRPEATLADAGLDSVGVVELSIILADLHGVQLSEEEIHEAGSIGAIGRLVEERMPAA